MPLQYVHPNTGERFYDVEKSVGVDSVNQSGDVRLVQYMLREIYSAGFSIPPGAPLATDGWIGPKTISWILKFQNDVNAIGFRYADTEPYRNPSAKRCVKDGRVDGCLPPNGMGSVSQLPYTIVWMNNILKRINPASHQRAPLVVPMKPSTFPSRPNPYNALVPESGGY